ncbi:hypothetical protein FACS189490_02910 [Clostridia bacterium]|nr:hypothetical protein FACS189490_02910 [Clostridia bacterium]
MLANTIKYIEEHPLLLGLVVALFSAVIGKVIDSLSFKWVKSVKLPQFFKLSSLPLWFKVILFVISGPIAGLITVQISMFLSHTFGPFEFFSVAYWVVLGVSSLVVVPIEVILFLKLDFYK